MCIRDSLRSGELRALRWSDLDWAGNRLKVNRTISDGQYVSPKTRASRRFVDLPSSIAVQLKEWEVVCPRGEENLVFPTLSGSPIGHANLLQRIFYPALARAGLRRIRFHDLRHTYASLLIASGEDIVRVSRLLGHANPAITLQVYSHMLPSKHYKSADELVALVDREGSSIVA